MLQARLNVAAPVRSWTIVVNGVAVWTQINVVAIREIAELVKDGKAA